MKRVVRVGVDIGGTFTDLVFAREDGGLDRLKVPSTRTTTRGRLPRESPRTSPVGSGPVRNGRRLAG